MRLLAAADTLLATPHALKAPRLLRAACVALAVWFIAAFLYIALNSITYPYHLEWIEGQSIDVIARITRGLPVYSEPSFEYVPFLYTPLYYYVSAIVSLFTGVDFFAGRLVSLCAALGTGTLIFRWIRRENGSWQSALVGAGLFYATYRYSGRWFDLARVDSLSLFFAVAGTFVFRYYRGPAGIAGAAALMAAAFFTKQSGFLCVAPFLLGGIIRNPNHGLSTLVAATALTLGVMSYLEESSSGWFSYYVFAVPAGHTVDHLAPVNFWTHDLGLRTGALLLMGLALLAAWYKPDRRKCVLYATLLAGFVLAAYSSRLHRFGYVNTLMPLHAILALFAGLAFAAAENAGPRLRLLAPLVVAGQLLSMLYNPAPLVPSQKMLEAGNKFIEELKKFNGDVLIPDLQFIETKAGKKSYAFGMPAFDVFRAGYGKTSADMRARLGREYREVIQQKKFAAIMPGRLIFFDIPNLDKYYRRAGRLEYPEGVALDSINLRKMDVYIPIKAVPAPNPVIQIPIMPKQTPIEIPKQTPAPRTMK